MKGEGRAKLDFRRVRGRPKRGNRRLTEWLGRLFARWRRNSSLFFAELRIQWRRARRLWLDGVKVSSKVLSYPAEV